MKKFVSTLSNSKDHTEIIALIISELDERKGEEIKVYSSEEYLLNFDYAIVCYAISARHANAMASYVMQKLKDHGLASKVDGMGRSNWILVSYQDSISVNIITREEEENFNLNKFFARKKFKEKLSDQSSAAPSDELCATDSNELDTKASD